MEKKILEGKIALITGGAMGIGKEIARLFADQGADAVILDIAEKEGKQAADEIKRNGGKASFIVCDVRQWQAGGDCEKIIQETLAQFGRIDILVNNAGRHIGKGFLELTDDNIKDITDLNYFGPFKLMRLVARAMIKEEIKGSIINITSVHSSLVRGFPEYFASKAALKALTKEAAYEFGPYGIRVNAIAPGATETMMGGPEFWGVPENRRQITKKTPLGRIIQPRDIAETALFLADNSRSGLITGAEFVVDGGYSLRNPSVEDKEFPSQE